MKYDVEEELADLRERVQLLEAHLICVSKIVVQLAKPAGAEDPEVRNALAGDMEALNAALDRELKLSRATNAALPGRGRGAR